MGDFPLILVGCVLFTFIAVAVQLWSDKHEACKEQRRQRQLSSAPPGSR